MNRILARAILAGDINGVCLNEPGSYKGALEGVSQPPMSNFELVGEYCPNEGPTNIIRQTNAKITVNTILVLDFIDDMDTS